MKEQEKQEMQPKDSKFDLVAIIDAAMKIPGVKVNRRDFLTEQFKEYSPDMLDLIIAEGPVAAGCSQSELHKRGQRIIKSRSAASTGASFLAGIPGGWFMAATIPADILQFYAVALRMAQELAYLYGEQDMWCDGTDDSDKVFSQLILYCGVMLGASGASQAVRVMSSALAKQALKKLPQKPLMQTFYYPIIKTILKFFGISITKSTFAKGISKALPIVGGVISGGITLASMLPMGNRLAKTLDKAHFGYTQNDFERDMEDIQEIGKQEEQSTEDQSIEVPFRIISEEEPPKAEPKESPAPKNDILTQIQKAKELYDAGVLSEEEFIAIKTKLITEL